MRKQLIYTLFLCLINSSLWAQQWTQLGNDIDGEAIDDYSGWSVSLDGNRLAIGATGNDGNGVFAGHTRVYEYSTITAAAKVAATTKNIEVFPNPSKEQLYVKLESVNDKQAVVRLFNTQGLMIYNRSMLIAQDGLIEIKDLQTMEIGVYLVQITIESGKSYNHKFIKG